MHYPAAFLSVFAGVSTLGAVWISDEFDDLRMQIYGLVLVPATVFFLFSVLTNPAFWASKQVLFKRIWVGLSVLYVWGAFLLINAVATSNRITVGKVIKQDLNEQSFFTPYRRGALGHVFRYRF